MAQRTEIGDLAIKISAQMDATVKAAIAETMKGFQGVEKSAEKTSHSMSGGLFSKRGFGSMLKMIGATYGLRAGLEGVNLLLASQEYGRAAGDIVHLADAQVKWTQSMADSFRIIPVLGSELSRLYENVKGLEGLKATAQVMREIVKATEDAAKMAVQWGQELATMQLEARNAPESEKRKLKYQQEFLRKEQEISMLRSARARTGKELQAARGVKTGAARGLAGAEGGVAAFLLSETAVGQHYMRALANASKNVTALEQKYDDLSASIRKSEDALWGMNKAAEQIVSTTAVKELADVSAAQEKLFNDEAKARIEQKERFKALREQQIRDLFGATTAITPESTQDIAQREADAEGRRLVRVAETREANKPGSTRYAAAMEKGSAEAYSMAYGNARGGNAADKTATNTGEIKQDIKTLIQTIKAVWKPIFPQPINF